MKKILYGTSALLVAGFFASAAEAAQPLTLAITGDLNAWVGYAKLKNTTENYNKFDVSTHGQLQFEAETVLDNGLKLGTVAEIDLDDSNDGWLDDVYVYGESKFGKAVIGAVEGGSGMLHHDAYIASPLSNNDIVTWLGGVSYVGPSSTAADLEGNAQKITYITPSFMGLKAAVSYIPGADFKPAFSSGKKAALDNTVVRNNLPGFYNAYTFTAAYEAKMKGVKLGADAGYANYNVKGADSLSVYNGAISAEMAGFVASIGYLYADKGYIEVDNSQVLEIGISYKVDKMGVSATWLNTKTEFKTADDTEVDLIRVDGTYELNAGIDAFVGFAYAKETTQTRSNPKAYTVVTGLGLSF